MISSELVFTGYLDTFEQYEWSNCQGPAVTARGEKTGITRPFREFNGLFVELARLDISPESLLDFCHQYGYWNATYDEWHDGHNRMESKVDQWLRGEHPELFRLELQTRITIDSDSDGFRSTVPCEGMWAIVQAQFNLAVVEGSIVRDCQHCGRAYLVSPPISRKTRLYCSDYCRGVAYRERTLVASKTAKRKEKADVTPKKRQPKKKGTGRGRAKKSE